MALRRTGQRQLAEVSGISVATIRLLQRGAGGRRARDETLAALSRALDWPAEQLVLVLLGGGPAEDDRARPRAVRTGIRPRGRAHQSKTRRSIAGGVVDAWQPGGRVSDRRALAAVAEDLADVADLLGEVLGRLAVATAEQPQADRP
ncbi:hypothetical protein [Pseudofrankia saprophytica]